MRTSSLSHPWDVSQAWINLVWAVRTCLQDVLTPGGAPCLQQQDLIMFLSTNGSINWPELTATTHLSSDEQLSFALWPMYIFLCLSVWQESSPPPGPGELWDGHQQDQRGGRRPVSVSICAGKRHPGTRQWSQARSLQVWAHTDTILIKTDGPLVPVRTGEGGRGLAEWNVFLMSVQSVVSSG